MDICNMKSEDIKKIMKENRKFKNRLYWKCWREMNERYNMGDV